jgi:hypothetical protein
MAGTSSGKTRPLSPNAARAEDERGDEGDLVALEEVGGHAGAVADVVADVVGDRGGVARVVLGDALLDLADEVGADVGGLGEDAAADPHEQREQRAAEAEALEDVRRVFWKRSTTTLAPSRPRPTVNMPTTPPVRKATKIASVRNCRAGRRWRLLHRPPACCRCPRGGKDLSSEHRRHRERAERDQAPTMMTRTRLPGEVHDGGKIPMSCVHLGM